MYTSSGFEATSRPARRRWLYLLAAAAASLAVAGAEAGTDVKGAACHGGNCTAVKDFLFDTGADETFISRANAAAMGLLADGNGDGTPDQSAGSKPFNGGAIQTWCFNNVAVGAVSSNKQNCVNLTTVYVSKTAGGVADGEILGEPWQQRVDACYRAKDKSTAWPWTPPAPATPSKPVVPTPDSSGEVKPVLEGVVLSGPFGEFRTDMVILSGSDLSIIPASVAAAIGALPVGQVDLSVDDPELLVRIQIASMDLTGQTVFDVIELDAWDIGIGPLHAGPHQVLVSDDLNSQFGVLGDDMLPFDAGTFEEYMLAVNTNKVGSTSDCCFSHPGPGCDDKLCTAQVCEVDLSCCSLLWDDVCAGLAISLCDACQSSVFGTLFYLQVDCDGNNIPDAAEILNDPALDADNNGVLDVCQGPEGAICTTTDCIIGPPDQAAMLGGLYQGDGTTCGTVLCPPIPCDPLGALTIVEGSLFIVNDGVDEDLDADAASQSAAAGAAAGTADHFDAEAQLADAAAQAGICAPCSDPTVPIFDRANSKMIEARNLRLAAEAQIASAGAQIQAAGPQLINAQGLLDLAKVQLILEPADTDRAKTKLAAAKMELDRAKTKLDSAKADLKRAKDKLNQAGGLYNQVRGQLQQIAALLIGCGPCAVNAINALNFADASIVSTLGNDAGAVSDLGDGESNSSSSGSNAGTGSELTVEATALLDNCVTCPWDCAPPPDGVVSAIDFLTLLIQWGQVGSSCDIDGGGVSTSDFLDLLSHWGPC